MNDMLNDDYLSIRFSLLFLVCVVAFAAFAWGLIPLQLVTIIYVVAFVAALFFVVRWIWVNREELRDELKR